MKGPAVPARLSNDAASSRLHENGYEAREPFPGLTSSPWQAVHLECGQPVIVTLNGIRLGRRIPCSCNSRQAPARKGRPSASRITGNPSKATQRMRVAGWEPLEPYPGSHYPWRCRCTGCGKEGTPRLHDVGKTKCCRTCSGRERVTSDKAEKAMLAAGWRPLVPFPGPGARWACTCMRCGFESSPSYTVTNSGKSRCRICSQRAVGRLRLQKNEPAAVKIMRDARLVPLELYPGSGKAWLCRCLRCGSMVRPRHSDVLSGHGGCGICRRANQGATRKAGAAGAAEARVRVAGYTPLAPYPGMHATWSCLCRCGRETEVWVSALGGGSRGCRWCTDFGFKLSVPAVAYLLVNKQLAAIKVGVTASDSSRLRVFKRHGWQAVHIEDFDTGFEALAAEKTMLDWWRTDLGLPAYLSPEDMPIGGSRETAELESMPAYIATERLKEAAVRIRELSPVVA